MTKFGITAALLATLPLLAACGEPLGPKNVLSQEQFAELKVNCGLDDARLIPSNRTETTTLAGGVPSTITYENADPDQMTIKLSRKRADGEIAQVILCVNGEFERLNADAFMSFA